MRRIITIAAVLVVAALNAPAHADAAATSAATANQAQIAKKNSTQRTTRAPRPSDNEVTYDRDSKDPNVGWHTQGGMRVCTADCDNPEIPGSGYTCRDVNVLGMAMRECNSSNW